MFSVKQKKYVLFFFFKLLNSFIDCPNMTQSCCISELDTERSSGHGDADVTTRVVSSDSEYTQPHSGAYWLIIFKCSLDLLVKKLKIKNKSVVFFFFGIFCFNYEITR